MHLLTMGRVAKTLVIGATLAGFLAFNAPQIRADEHECQERISRSDHRLHEAIEKHGYHSRQAEHARQQLHEAREYCWNTYHRWWDEDDRRWHSDRDWRDDDHEHYRDRDRDRPPR